MIITQEKKEYLAVILICFVVFAAYLNTLPNTFIFDDRHMIQENDYIKHLHTLPLVFKDKISSYPITKGMYRPVLMLTFAFNYLTGGGLKPYSYHLINILIHFLNALLLYLLLKLFLKNLSFALRLGITLIFSLHPLNTEAVAYISSRSTILSTLFILSGFYAYVRWRISCQRHLYLLSLGLYLLALLTKESGLAFLGLIVAYEFVYTENIFRDLKGFFLRFLPFVLLTAGYLFLIKSVLGGVFGLFSKVQVPQLRSLGSNILTQAAVSFFYIYLFIFPLNLCVDHNFPVINSFTNPLGFISIISISILITAALFFRKRANILSFSCLWYFIALLPQFYARLNIFSAEHHVYLAGISLYFVLGYLLTRWKIKGIYLRQLFFFILSLFFILTFMRNFQWRNEYLIWKFTLKANPNSDIAKGSLGLYLVNKGFIAEGKKYLKEAVDSKRAISRQPSLLNLATYYALYEKKPEKGLEILKQNEDCLLRTSTIAYLKSLGIVYMTMGKFQEAKDTWEKAIQIYPESPEIKSNLGWLYLENLSDKKKAKKYFEAAIKDNPDLSAAHLGLGEVLGEEGNLKQAIAEYRKTIELAPDNPDAYYKLGLIYAKKLLSPEAEWYFKKTIELSPNYAPAYYNLCIFYLSLPVPDYKKAEAYFSKAKELGYKVDREIEEMLLNKGL